MSPLPRSTWMLAGEVKRAALEFSGAPFSVPSAVSNAPFRPICCRSLLPSWVYFWIMPPGELAIQTLLSWSKWQVCRRYWVGPLRSPATVPSMRLGSPQEWTTEPAGSSSIISGASRPAFRSPSSTSWRLSSSTWSWASMQWPPKPPVTHRFGNGFGKVTSTS